MGVKFTNEAEKQRMIDSEKQRQENKWEIYSGNNIVQALHKARELGWKEDKVQVRYETINNETTYFIEPYERGCGCRGLLKYKEYFN